MFCTLIPSNSRRDRDHERPPRHDRPHQPGVGRFAMWMFLASLAGLFVPLLIIYLLMRSEAPVWPPPGLPRMPGALWLSTGLLVATSVVLHLGLVGIRRGALDRLRTCILVASGLTLGFLICQVYCWVTFFSHEFPPAVWRYAGFFGFFCAVHAAHIIGGLVPLGFVTRNSFADRYDALHHRGVRHCAMYWHFIDGVWLVMFTVIMFPGRA